MDEKKSRFERAKDWCKEHEDALAYASGLLLAGTIAFVSAKIGYKHGFLNGKLTNVEDTLVKKVRDATFNRTLDAIYDSGEHGFKCSTEITPGIKETYCFLAKKVEN